MKNLSNYKIQIISALTWAAVMIASSLVVRDTQSNDYMFNILLVGATMHFLLLSKPNAYAKKACEEEVKTKNRS